MADHPTLPFETAERWLPVIGWEGLYEVSDLGRVRSLPREGTRGNVLTPHVRQEYLHVFLARDGRRKHPPVHQLVAQAFIGARPPGQEVRHGPNGKFDNRASQLCYGTQSENQRDRVRDGTANQGERHGHARLTVLIVAECRRRAAAGEPSRALAKEFGVDACTMLSAVTGKTWEGVEAEPVRGGIRSGERHYLAKLTAQAVGECRERYQAGESQRDLATEYGVCVMTMNRAIRGETWKSTLA